MSVEKSPARRGVTPPGGPSSIDLLRWSETNLSAADPSTMDSPGGRPTIRMHQPAGGISSIAFGEKMSVEEAEGLLKRRPGSEVKKKEMSGSGIFSSEAGGDALDFTNGLQTPPSVRSHLHQPPGGVSQIMFGIEESASPKKPTSIAEVAKQRELSGSHALAEDAHLKRNFSNAKAKELVGSNIFGPPPEIPMRSRSRNLEAREPKDVKGSAEPAPRNVHTSVKVSNPAGGRSQIFFGQETPERHSRKAHYQKVADLSGNNIFKGDTPVSSAEKPLSSAKLREISGSDIFADDKPVGRDCVGGIRKPPGGESSIALV
ncbi:hypothetical protein O6H91_05G128000 [Diphasiastrum complanatum]|uniref:Uncharacterized protein n=1 Tax=Diphasiastrum complanatum TaxID=34168 RepID=A0ACC2DTZ8_DIPCM|nr:hypothetical protein O6H91_Y461300 [Diphasiastrum complanatum]KAJ7557477.1 hypothetical protein O6H91_05G128000 [Diphasiastrum complanatum]